MSMKTEELRKKNKELEETLEEFYTVELELKGFRKWKDKEENKNKRKIRSTEND